jgi:hypothetical protein
MLTDESRFQKPPVNTAVQPWRYAVLGLAPIMFSASSCSLRPVCISSPGQPNYQCLRVRLAESTSTSV